MDINVIVVNNNV